MLLVADMERAVRFYTEALGGELAVSSPEWSEVNVAGATVALHAGGAGADTPTGLGFEVDDIDGAVSAVVAAGGHVIGEPRERPQERIRLAEVADSEGNWITVAQTLS